MVCNYMEPTIHLAFLFDVRIIDANNPILTRTYLLYAGLYITSRYTIIRPTHDVV